MNAGLMGSLAMVEDLARLIKDNLSSKHIVLSAEDMFIEFLDSNSKASVLMLEPMIAYHRMLLHRLADIFGFAHNSIGEGCDRRLVVERLPSSVRPDVLVSDILDVSDSSGVLNSPSAPQLLKRSLDRSGSQNRDVRIPVVSFQEREAAYFAARERIFSDLGQDGSDVSYQRTRGVPVVARRMIAHALGKRVLEGSTIQKRPIVSLACEAELAVCTTESRSTAASASQSCLDHVLGSETRSTNDGCIDEVHSPPAPADGSKSLPLVAAKRMLAHALGFQPSCRVLSRSERRDPTGVNSQLEE